jgi:phosphate transport system permease protein
MTSSLSNTSFRYNADWWLTVVTRAAAVLSAAVVLMVIAFVVIESVPALRRIGMTRFIHDDSWHPLSDQFNLLPMIVATLVSTAGATPAPR